MFDLFYFKEEIEINDINKLSYSDFLKHEIVLYVSTTISKKQLQRFRSKIKDKSFYPVHIIRENQNDSKENKEQKLKLLEIENEELFKLRYLEIAKKQFGINSLFEIKDEIKKCPFCNNKKVVITHDYSKEHTNCNLFLKCDFCTQILDRECFFLLIDASYVYDKNIEKLIDLYCKSYNEMIKIKIFDKLKTIDKVGFLL